jgi:4-hydroxybenzoate polyprenyltransferase
MTEAGSRSGRLGAEAPVLDAAGNWVDRWAPGFAQPYLRLARLDRPIGTWLLLWPCLWALALAAPRSDRILPDVRLMALFAIGALAMRGAGCTYNDIVDRDLDAGVERTRNRPVASGRIGVPAACAFLGAQALVGLGVLLCLNRTTIWLGIASLIPVALYPFAKRVTDWPQAVLGLTFNWGALVGWTAVTGRLEAPAALLYAGAFFWTLGYDTIYAHQDRADDAVVGVRSSALRLGARTYDWLWGFYGLALAGFASAGWAAGLGWGFWPVLAVAGAHLVRQRMKLDIDDPGRCLEIFRSNRTFGTLLFLAILAGSLTAARPAFAENRRENPSVILNYDVLSHLYPAPQPLDRDAVGYGVLDPAAMRARSLAPAQPASPVQRDFWAPPVRPVPPGETVVIEGDGTYRAPVRALGYPPPQAAFPCR